MSLRTKLILIAAGLSMLGIGLAVGATFGALQDWDSQSYTTELAAISPRAGELHAQEYSELTARVARVAIVSSVATVLAIGALSAFAIRRELRPLQKIASTAAEIGSGDLTRRIPAASHATEIGQLSGALNAMLSQLETAFRDKELCEARLRRFVADASHELRTLSPPSAATPSCSAAAPPNAQTTSPRSSAASNQKPRAWESSSTNCSS